MAANYRNFAFNFDFPTVEKKPKEPQSIEIRIKDHEGRENGGDCSVRAVATFFDLPYAEVMELARERYGYRPRGGMSLFNFERLMAEFGMMFVEARIRINSKSAKNKLPKRGILLFRSHVAAYEHGVLFDAYKTTERVGNRQTVGYFIEKNKG